MNAFEKTGAALLFSDGILIDGEGNDLKSRLWEVYRIDPESIEKKGIFEEILRRPIVTGAAMAFSRSLAQRWDRVPAPFLHDEWLSVLAAAADAHLSDILFLQFSSVHQSVTSHPPRKQVFSRV